MFATQSMADVSVTRCAPLVRAPTGASHDHLDSGLAVCDAQGQSKRQTATERQNVAAPCLERGEGAAPFVVERTSGGFSSG